jgi:large conductance mechanosensitive channel
MKNFFREFEEFAVKGNVLQLAVGVVLGAAFNQVTTTLANNILTPPIGALLGGLDFAKLSISLAGKAEIQYGLFLQAILNFIIVALALFLLVKVINRLTRKKENKEQNPVPQISEELKVLKEIRDSLVIKE